MKLWFRNLPEHLTSGMADFAKEYGFSLEQGGLEISLRETDERILEIARKAILPKSSIASPSAFFGA